MKFDFAVGNPPYMEITDSESTRNPPVYNLFMEETFKVAKVVELITPARFLFNAGYTPKQWNKKMLNDPHFKVLNYASDSRAIFPNQEIKGGVVITYRDSDANFGPIKVFTKYTTLNDILKKVSLKSANGLDSIISSPLSYRLSEQMKKENPDLPDRLRSSAFTNLAPIFFDKEPDSTHEYIRMIGLLNGNRVIKKVRRDYIEDNSNTLDEYCLLVPKASGSGVFGETLSSFEKSDPGLGYTQTFIAIGHFNSMQPVIALEKYIKTKFARAMLGVLKITQDCPGPKWHYVPLQDFTENSDIDWSKSVSEIDQQLYKKYGLSEEEIDFVEEKVQAME